MTAGYSRLASLMGAHPETAIVRRFGFLNALNLLYLQAELAHLENDLREQAAADAESGHFERSLYSRDWQTLSESGATEDGNPAQWQLVLRVREKLNEYSRCTYPSREVGPPGTHLHLETLGTVWQDMLLTYMRQTRHFTFNRRLPRWALRTSRTLLFSRRG